jgi:PAS domain S-box-containing protein
MIIWQFTPPGIIKIGAALLALLVAAIVWKRRKIPGGLWFFLVMVAIAEWSACDGIADLINNPGLGLLLGKISYIGISTVGTLWFLFALRYNKNQGSLRGFRHGLLFLVPVTVIIFAFTNDYHHLLWHSVTQTGPDNSRYLLFNHGPIVFIIVVYSYLLLIAGSILMLRMVFLSSSLYRNQAIAIGVGTLIPFLSHIIYILGLIPFAMDMTPIAFTLTGVIFVFAIFRFGFLDIIPIAYETLFSSMTDGVLVIDSNGRIVVANPLSIEYMGLSGRIVGQDVRDVMGEISIQLLEVIASGRRNLEVSLNSGLIIDIRVSPVLSGKRGIGSLVVFRDITERKTKENILRISEAKLNAILENSFDAIGVHVKGIWEVCNPAALRLFGYSSSNELIGTSILNVIAPEERQRITEYVRKRETLDPSAPVLYSTTGLRSDGSKFDMDVALTSYLLEDIRYVLVILRDTTRQRRAEEALRESEANLKAVIEVTDESIILFSKDHTVLMINEIAATRLGCSIDEVIGKTLISIFNNDIYSRRNEFVNQSISSRKPLHFEDERNGRWFSNHLYPIINTEGDVDRLAVFSRDITDRKLSEEALKESERKYRQLFENMEEGFSLHEIITDASGKPVDFRFLDTNQAYERQTGQRREDVVGHTMHEVMPNADQSQIEKYGRVAITGEPLSFEYYSYSYKRYLHIHAFQPSPGYFATIFEDITEFKKVDEKLKEINKELEERVTIGVQEIRLKDHLLILQSRQAAIGEMLSNIAHQWRQPINALGLMLQNMYYIYSQGNMDEARMASYQKKGLQLIDHMSHTIDDFRSFFIPEKKPQEFSLKTIILKTKELVDESLQSEGVSLSIEDEADCLVWGYSNEFGQVLLNLIQNALEALKERGVKDRRINIREDVRTDIVSVVVTDNAGGIPPDVIRKIFDPYFTTKEKGTGIGLYMSKMIVEGQLNGKLLADNTNEGAEFTIVLNRKTI